MQTMCAWMFNLASFSFLWTSSSSSFSFSLFDSAIINRPNELIVEIAFIAMGTYTMGTTRHKYLLCMVNSRATLCCFLLFCNVFLFALVLFRYNWIQISTIHKLWMDGWVDGHCPFVYNSWETLESIYWSPRVSELDKWDWVRGGGSRGRERERWFVCLVDFVSLVMLWPYCLLKVNWHVRMHPRMTATNRERKRKL